MLSRKLLALLALLIFNLAVHAESVELAPNHPDRYTVVKGDTLWDIAGRFLKDPWRWPNIWNKNQQIKNPHLIYPGDVVVLNYVNGEPELGVLRNEKLSPNGAAGPLNQQDATTTAGSENTQDTDVHGLQLNKLSPKIHDSAIEAAIPTIKPDTIAPFLTQPLVVSKNDLNRAGYVTVGVDDRIAMGDRSEFYARGLGHQAQSDAPGRYQIFRLNGPLRNPGSRKILGYEALYLGDATVVTPGNPSKLEVTRVAQEIQPGDRLLPAPKETPLPYFYPHAPTTQVHGRILSVNNGVAEFGPQTVVSVSLGRAQGMEEGHVLRIMHHVGKTLDPTNGHSYRIPDEDSGLLMVFRVFDKVSYALVMQASRSISIYDVVKTP